MNNDPQAISKRTVQQNTTAPPAITAGGSANDPAPLLSDFTIVAVGASAGGLEPFRKLIDSLPDDSGMAFILVQHLDPNHESLLVDLLTSHTRMAVTQAVEGERLVSNHLYIIPPGIYLSVASGTLHLSQPQIRHRARLPFDYLLKSLAQEVGGRTIGIILSGTGADGSEGLKTLKAMGGFVIVQSPEEAEYDGMPRNALLTGQVDLTLPVGEMAAAIMKRHRHTSPPAITRPNSPSSPIHPSSRGQPSETPESETPQIEVMDDPVIDGLAAIIDLLRTRTSYDFTLYKQGTLRRRIERRIGLIGGSAHGASKNQPMAGYIASLKADPLELERLAKDLLINVTNFFRDQTVFTYIAKTALPALVNDHTADQPLRVWIVGCSTGEEAYSLAMLLHEEISRSKRMVKIQIFASDVDADAVALARDGLYPETITADVSPERLARFFLKEEHGYKVTAELRASVVFTVQDILSDPPLSRIDLISCRNLLIYFGPEAQAKVIALFHFSLRQGGLLLLGSSETIGNGEGRFEVVAKSERVYRRVGQARLGDLGFALGMGDGRAILKPSPSPTAPSRQTALAELTRRVALKIYAPALVVINRKLECLYFLGPTDRYLHHAEGHPTNDLLGKVPPAWRGKLRGAIGQVSPQNPHVSVDCGLIDPPHGVVGCHIEVHSITHQTEELLLVGFLESPRNTPSLPLIQTVKITTAQTSMAQTSMAQTSIGDSGAGRSLQPMAGDDARFTALEQELEATQAELHAAQHSLDVSSEEQKAVNEEMRSVNEEFQSTNEELLTSKEELQSLNEELTVLNNQLQETLDHQRKTSNDLQNVLYSTDVATLFLDPDLNIRFFTPATKALFKVIATDIGRPLHDLHSLATDTQLAVDARAVLADYQPIEREIETNIGTGTDTFFIRRILPYRNHDDHVEGVVITFTDISERRHVRKALEVAKQEAELANRAKSRFLAAASHDLRQPLQTIAFVQGILAKIVEGEQAQAMVKRLDDTLHVISDMLDALLNINQIEAGVVQAGIVRYPLGDLFNRLRQEFSYHAQAKNLALTVMPCRQFIDTDPRLLEYVLRNLLANAIKYTMNGRVLLGCRRQANTLTIEIWDTGIGIPTEELETIFEEYRQLGNAAGEMGRDGGGAQSGSQSGGLGLGLAIVKRLVAVLGYTVQVRTCVGKGSVFAVQIALPTGGLCSTPASGPTAGHSPALSSDPPPFANVGEGRSILVVEDDPDVRELLMLVLEAEGYRVSTTSDGVSALELVDKVKLQPDLIIADYNLPKGMDGLQVAARLRAMGMPSVPVVILTGDIATVTLTEIAHHDCFYLNKPVKLNKIIDLIETLLPPPVIQPVVVSSSSPDGSPDGSPNGPPDGPLSATIYVVDDDPKICDSISTLLAVHGYTAATFATAEAFLAQHRSGEGGCLLIDAYLPGIDGFTLLQRLRAANDPLPTIMITGNSDVPMAVKAMRAGALDFIEKPVAANNLLDSIVFALELSRDTNKMRHWQSEAQSHMAGLTERQKQIMALVLAGHPSKNIAADLGISQRTVENHRNAIMTRTGCKSLPALARLAMAAASPVKPSRSQPT